MREQITSLATRGEPSVLRLMELDGPVEFQTQRLTSEVHGERRSLAFTTVEAAIPFLVWMLKKETISRLDALISEESDDAAALSHEARQQRETEAMSDLLSVERDEAALTWQAQAQNLPIEHRSDINPVALLGPRAGHDTARNTRNDAGIFVADAAMNNDRAARADCANSPAARARDGRPSRATEHEPRWRFGAVGSCIVPNATRSMELR